jgi:hypothetical protein
MQTLVAILIALAVFFLVIKTAAPSSPTCPPGYAKSPVNSTWAGWSYNCLPKGIASSLVGIPSDTYVRPVTTIYAPIVAGTGAAPSCGEPAKLDEFGGRPTVYSRV